MKTTIAIISLFIVLSIIDFTTTIYAVGNGIGQEGNVLMAKAIENGFYSIVKAGGIVLISLFLAKLSRRHEKAFKVASYFVIAITLIAVVNNFMVINASALTIGNNVVSVGAGYKYITADDRAQFVYAQSYQDDQGNTKYRIRLVALDTDGTYSDTILVTNISSSVRSVCIASNHKLYFSLSNNEIWVRISTSTNPLDFYQYKDDTNYFQKIATGYTAHGLTPLGNRIYFFDSTHVYFVDLSNYESIAQLVQRSKGYGTGILGIAANNQYVYLAREYGPYQNPGILYVDVINHAGDVVQSYSISGTKWPPYFTQGFVLLSNNFVYIATNHNDIKVPLREDKTLDWDNRTSLTQDVVGKQQARECYGSNIAVYLYNSQVNTFSLDSTFVPDESGGGGGGTGTTQYYNVSLYFVNAENNQFLSDAFVTMYVSKGGQTQFSLNQIVENGYTFTAEEGSTVMITYAYRDGYVSEMSKQGYSITLILDPFINPFLQFTDHVNITILFYPTEQNVSVHFIFLDAMTNAQIDNVTLVITDSGGNEIVNGTFDYTYTLEDAVRGEYYWYNVTKEGYCPYWNGFQVPYGGELKDYYVEVYLVPLLGEEYLTDPVNNTIVEFYVLDAISYSPLAGAVITINGVSKVTNSQGFTYFEVPKNDTYSYAVQRAGYYSKSGVVQVGTETVLETVYLLEMPSATPTTPTIPAGGGGSTGGGTGGGGIDTGYTPDEDLRQAARDTLTQFYKSVPGFFGLIFLLFIMASMQAVMRRR